MSPFFIAIRLFIRLLIGLILLSVGVSKLAHPQRFRRAIQDYQLLPATVDSRLAFSALLAYGLPIIEILTGVGLISGFLLIPVTVLAAILMIGFSVAMGINLARGRRDLSCHCGGAIGDHRISWWLVGRNGVLLVGLLLLLFTPVDTLTVGNLLRSPSSVSTLVWTNTVLPVVLLVGIILVSLFLVNTVRNFFRS